MGVLGGVGISEPSPARREREAVRLQGPRASAGLKRDTKGNELRSLGEIQSVYIVLGRCEGRERTPGKS